MCRFPDYPFGCLRVSDVSRNNHQAGIINRLYGSRVCNNQIVATAECLHQRRPYALRCPRYDGYFSRFVHDLTDMLVARTFPAAKTHFT